MLIKLFAIEKNAGEFQSLSAKYQKLIAPYASLKQILCFNAKIAAAQKQGPSQARLSYEEAFVPHIKGFCVILHERGRLLESKEFAALLGGKSELSFFIGGAFGFREDFTQNFTLALSLSPLTLAHSLARLVLLEQIYRAFSILHQHPYHK